MLRRDYILRLIEQIQVVLASLQTAKQAARWDDVRVTLDQQLQRLVGCGVAEAARRSEMELVAALLTTGSTHEIRENTLFLIALLTEAGGTASTTGDTELSSACFLRALHLLLGMSDAADAFRPPAFVPDVDRLVEGIEASLLPPQTIAMVMRHHERTGNFSRAEDALYGLIEADPTNRDLLEFGKQFYQRLCSHPDPLLEDGNLPRNELESGLTELEKRLASL